MCVYICICGSYFIFPHFVALVIKQVVKIFCFRPTGGSDKWTATACDCLSLYLTGAVASMILQVCDGVTVHVS